MRLVWVEIGFFNTLNLRQAKIGEVSEWLKERAWKVRIRQKCIAGSNPALSAE